MKRLCIAVLAAVCCWCAAALPVFGEEYDGDQVILSWTEDNAHTQTITWRSNSAGAGYVQYNREGLGLSSRHQVRAQTAEVKEGRYYRCEATIRGLSQKTTYSYRIGDGKNWSDIRTFTTAPSGEAKTSDETDSFQFLYLGDVQYQRRNKDYAAWAKLVQDIRQRNPGIAFALTGGDMVNSPRNLEGWELFLAGASPVFSSVPLMTAIGNHETTVKADTYLKMLALPQNGPKEVSEEFYSFDYGNCHFTVVNTCFFLDNRKAVLEEDWELQLAEVDRWLQEDLTQNSARWKIVVMHHPAYGISDGDPIYEEIRREWEPVFEQGGVDLVLCGHQHLYMRTEEIGGITYVMGNSGKRRSTYFNGENVPEYVKSINATDSNYQIIKVSREQLILESYDEKGQIIDKWRKKEGMSFWIKAAIAAGIIVSMTVAAIFVRLRVGKRANIK